MGIFSFLSHFKLKFFKNDSKVAPSTLPKLKKLKKSSSITLHIPKDVKKQYELLKSSTLKNSKIKKTSKWLKKLSASNMKSILKVSKLEKSTESSKTSFLNPIPRPHRFLVRFFSDISQFELVHQLSFGSSVFEIVGNKGKGLSLFKSISQALTGQEGSAHLIKLSVLSHISTNWEVYERAIYFAYGEKIKKTSPQLTTKAYVDYMIKTKEAGSLVELEVASKLYFFTFSVFSINLNSSDNYPLSLNVQNCNNLEILSGAKVKFYFLSTSSNKNFGYNIYELLLPVNSLFNPPSGSYPAFFREIICIKPEKQSLVSSRVKKVKTQFELVLKYKNEEFRYVKSFYTDILKLLSEYFYSDVDHDQIIEFQIHKECHVGTNSEARLKGAEFHSIPPDNLNPHENFLPGDDLGYLKLASAHFNFLFLVIEIVENKKQQSFNLIYSEHRNLEDRDIDGRSYKTYPFLYFILKRREGAADLWGRLEKIPTPEIEIFEKSFIDEPDIKWCKNALFKILKMREKDNNGRISMSQSEYCREIDLFRKNFDSRLKYKPESSLLIAKPKVKHKILKLNMICVNWLIKNNLPLTYLIEENGSGDWHGFCEEIVYPNSASQLISYSHPRSYYNLIRLSDSNLAAAIIELKEAIKLTQEVS